MTPIAIPDVPVCYCPCTMRPKLLAVANPDELPAALFPEPIRLIVSYRWDITPDGYGLYRRGAFCEACGQVYYVKEKEDG